jgi:CheY-like chemotaxis protein
MMPTHPWCTHLCVPRSHFCERLGSGRQRCSEECEHGTQQCVRHRASAPESALLFSLTRIDTKLTRHALQWQMSTQKPLNLLLVEDDLENEQLLAEVLIEIESNRQWCNWRNTSVVHAEQLRDALDCFRSHSFHVVLLNLTLPDSPVLLESFRKVNDCAGAAPIVVLADEEDEHLTSLLLREGAQDVLLKSELEPALLARSLRHAMERQHRVAMMGSSSFEDVLTETLTRHSFLYLGTHYMQFSRLTQVPLLLASIEISELSERTLEDQEARDLLLLRAAEVLGSTFEPPALVGRVGRNRFGLITAGLTETTLEALLNRAAVATENAATLGGRPSGTVYFSVAEIHAGDNLHEMLGQDGAEFAEYAHKRAKTAMLAD